MSSTVLVVGAGISGQQIADELVDAGRRTFLAVGRHRAWPRQYRGWGIQEWIGVLSSLHEEFGAADGDGGPVLPGLPVTAVRDKSDDLNLGTLAAKGVTLVGSVRAANGGRLLLKENVVATAEESARSFRRALDLIDTEVRERGFAAPEEHPAPPSSGRASSARCPASTTPGSRTGTRSPPWASRRTWRTAASSPA